MRKRLFALTAVAMLALGIAGCGGDDGSAGPQGPQGVQGPAGPAGPAGPGASGAVSVPDLTAEQLAALQINGEITSVSIASPPVVNFKLSDADGKPIVGIGAATTTSGGATVYSNIRFTIAKLVPGAAKSSDHWVNYIVTDNAGAASRPDAERNGTLVDNGDGTYTYTFARDIAAIKGLIDGMTFSGNNRKEDLGDLTYDPNLQHRVVIQISGSGLGNPANVVYNFVPATGAIAKASLAKDLVNIETCNTCHDKLAFHGGGRIDTDYCTTCHTTQRAYGRAKTVSPFPALVEAKSVNATTGITSYTYTPDMYIADGEVLGNFVTLIHKIHNGAELTKQNYEYANVAFNNKAFSMLDAGQRMCTVCHDSDKAAKADLAYSKPTREACGACHDNVNFATGANHSPSNLIRVDDSTCDVCHTALQSQVDHRTVNLTTHNQAVTDGLANFTYEIKEAKVDPATNDLTIEFAIRSAVAPAAITTATPVTFVAPAAGVTAPLAGFTGSPSFLLAFAVPQDGIAAPADYNNLGNGQSNAQPRSVSIANLLNTANAANGKLEPAATAGYYVATIYGAGAWAMPTNAKMRTIALQGYFTQVAPAAPRHTISVVKTVTGDEARRKVVDARKCASCHEWFEGHGGNRVIGVETGTAELVCVTCHVPAIATSGRRIPDADMQNYAWTASDLNILAEWGVDRFAPNAALQLPVVSNNMKDMIHGIHAGRDRVVPFQDARDRGSVKVLLDFRRMDFPGTLSNCEGCHGTGTGFRPYNVVPTNGLVSRHEAIDAAYAAAILAGTATPADAGTALNSQSDTDTVVTPFAAACVSCHDHPSAKGHMQTNGARLFVPRSQAVGALEACQTCHGAGAEWDAATVHK